MKSFWSAERLYQENEKASHRLGQITCKKGTYDKEMFSKIYKEVLKFNNKKTTSILKSGRNLKRYTGGK